MQGINAIGCVGRFFGGGERRLRHSNHQVLKCPRCDSVDTKFCYYNNYNSSQPRHFCKSCRRYWTKGGVLRNVPIGGGCRKTKRSKQKSSTGSNAQSSGSESSGPTAATPTSATTAAAEEGSFPINKPSDSSVVNNFPHARFFNANPKFDHQSAVNQSTEGQIFPTDNGSFTSMTTFGRADIPTTSCGLLHLGNQAPVSKNDCPGVSGTAAKEVFKMQEMTGGTSDEGVAAAQGWGRGVGAYQGLFDQTAAVDPAYWSQPQVTDSDLLSPLSFQPYKSRFPNMFF